MIGDHARRVSLLPVNGLVWKGRLSSYVDRSTFSTPRRFNLFLCRRQNQEEGVVSSKG